MLLEVSISNCVWVNLRRGKIVWKSGKAKKTWGENDPVYNIFIFKNIVISVPILIKTTGCDHVWLLYLTVSNRVMLKGKNQQNEPSSNKMS